MGYIQKILNDWASYENEKFRKGESPDIIHLDESWEVKYLTDKIREAVGSGVTEAGILNAIVLCSLEMEKPFNRQRIVTKVIQKLKSQHRIS